MGRQVVGDVVLMGAGDMVCADGAVFEPVSSRFLSLSLPRRVALAHPRWVAESVEHSQSSDVGDHE